MQVYLYSANLSVMSAWTIYLCEEAICFRKEMNENNASTDPRSAYAQ